MIEATQPNEILNPAELDMIERASSRLRVVQHEVIKATQDLAALEGEHANLLKNKQYQEAQLVELETRIETLRNQAISVEDSITQGKLSLESQRAEHEEAHQIHTKKHENLDVREANLVVYEKELADRHAAYVLKEKQVETEREEVEHARLAFLDAIESVTWK